MTIDAHANADVDAADHVLVIVRPNDGHVVVHCRALEVYRYAEPCHAAYAQYSRTSIFMRLQCVHMDRLQAGRGFWLICPSHYAG